MNVLNLRALTSVARRSHVLLTALVFVAVAGCHDDDGTGPAPTGTVAGTVSNNLGVPLAGIEVTVTPTGGTAPSAVTTDGDGEFSVGGVLVSDGKGSISLADLPDDCTDPGEVAYTGLANGETVTKDIVVPCEAATGALTVTIIGLVGLDGVVEVTGPNGFDTTLTATSTIDDLEPGSYTIMADTLVVDDPVVVSRFLAVTEDSPASVVAGDTAAATVTYAIRTGSGGLWFTNSGNGRVSRFAAGQLQASGSPQDTTSIAVPASPLFAAFDSSGNLWVSSATSDDLVAYTRDQLVGGGTPTPALTLSSAALDAPRGIAFDGNGNLWVANGGSGTIVQFSAAQVEDGGTTTPALGITGTGLANPTGIAFDAGGNLWVAGYQDSVVVEFSAGQLAAGGSAMPAITLSATSGSLRHPTAIAFDAAGNLWVANDTPVGADNILVAFTPAGRAASGSPAPGITIDVTGNPSPFGLAFDESGSLWVALNSGNAIVKYTAAQLAVGGSPTPAVTISPAAGGTLNAPSALVFDPHAEGLPIR